MNYERSMSELDETNELKVGQIIPIAEGSEKRLVDFLNGQYLDTVVAMQAVTHAMREAHGMLFGAVRELHPELDGWEFTIDDDYITLIRRVKK